MFTETSSGDCNDPDTAVLYLSPPIDFDSYASVNISMAYNMIGSTMGTLHIKEILLETGFQNGVELETKGQVG